MVYKIGNVADLARIPIADDGARSLLQFYANVLSAWYGEERNIDTDNGGYILYAPLGTRAEEIKACFDYTQHIIECVDTSGDACAAVYLLSSDYGVVIVMSLADAPEEITKEIHNEKEKEQ